MNYKDIHPLRYDGGEHMLDAQRGTILPESSYYKPCGTVLLRLDTIRQICEEHIQDGSISLKRIVVSDDHHEDLVVSSEEADEIAQTLRKNSADAFAGEIRSLTLAIRDLWTLLRARLR